MTDSLYECKRLLKQIQRDCAAITSGHQQAMVDVQKLYHPTTPTPPVPQAPAAPAERHWKYLGADGSLSPELSLRAARDPRLFAEICEELQAAADEAKGQS